MKKQYKITIEETCDDCGGIDEQVSGKIPYVCSGCDGTGYQQITVTVQAFKTLLEKL